MTRESCSDRRHDGRALDVQRDGAREQRYDCEDGIKGHSLSEADVLLFGDGLLGHARELNPSRLSLSPEAVV